jgi:DNA polymerase I-like protein with 3'-5' exonuclease and polymerase domains
MTRYSRKPKLKDFETKPVSREEARRLTEKYGAAYPQVKAWYKKVRSK